MPTVTRMTELKMSARRRKWTLAAFGTTYIGSGDDRPVKYTSDKLMYAGIKDPLYGAGWGPSGGTAVMTVTPWGINTRAVATAAITGDAVSSFTIVIKGYGYAAPPTVTITGGGGTGAVGTAVLTSQRVTSITVTNGGSGYTSAPTVSIATPNGEADDEIVTVTAYGSDFYMVAAGAGTMSGNVKGCETFFRDFSDNEPSLPGEESAQVELTASKLNFASNAVAADTELYITHREFFINYVDTIGSYFLGALVPYTGTGVDSAVIDVSSQNILNNRPLEDQRQTSLFPATRVAELYEGRIWGAGIEARSFADGASITFTQDSDRATISGDTFIEADRLRGIVDVDTKILVAVIDRVIDDTTVRILLPNNTETTNEWRQDTVTYTNVTLAGDEAMIVATPIYQGNPGGGIKYGFMTFNALDQIRDSNFYSTGAKVAALKRCGDKLAVIYDRGVAFFKASAAPEAPPTCVNFIAAEGVGAINPDAVWLLPDGTLWFQGNGRLWFTDGGNVTDASSMLGFGAFWPTKTAANMHAQNLYQTSYNPQTAETLFVNIPKKGEEAAALGRYGLLLNHGTGTLHGIRWPVKMWAAKRMLHDSGIWQFYGAAESTIYKLLVDGRYVDSYYDAEDVLQENEDIQIDATTGTFWVDGTIQLRAVRLILESLATSGLEFTVHVDYKKENIIPGTFTDDLPPVTISHKELKRAENVPLNADEGFGFQLRITGTTNQELTLIKLALFGAVQNARGFGDQ